MDRHSSSLCPVEAVVMQRPNQKPAWIVLVEDNPADAILVREALDEHGVHCDLTTLTDGERAFQLIERIDREQAECPDLVILDLKLPKKSGFEILERMRSSPICARIPVVIFTSSSAQQDKDRAAALGGTRYIAKPHRLAEFVKIGAVIKNILEGQVAEPEHSP
jgi:CheY-like chemotaxis protein